MTKLVWGTVTAVSPLRVQLDGDTAPVPFAPDSLIDPAILAVADRVRCELSSRRVIVVGRSGGLPFQIASGTVLISPEANTPTSVTVTFPVGRFTSRPAVVATPATSVPGTEVTGVGTSAAAASSVKIWLTRTNTVSTGVDWVAVGA